MARQLRIQYPGAFYHVTSRGNERQDIYKDTYDYGVFIEKLIESLDVYNVSLLCYVCMKNHFHFLLTTPDGNLSEFMRHFNIAYTYAFNRRYNRSGHLYQGRYKSYLIDADAYLQEVSRYIHLNPVRIKKYLQKGIAKKTEILAKYEFCSMGGYSCLKYREPFINYSTVLDYFGGDTAEGRKRYQQFVYKGIGEKISNPLESGKGLGIVGSEEFIETIRAKYLGKIKPEAQREQPHLKEVQKTFQPEELIEAFCEIAHVERDSICRRGKNSTDRAMLMELLYRNCNIAQPEIGRLTGGIDYSSVSYARKRLRQKMKKNSSLKQQFEKIEEGLSRLKI